MAKNHDSNRKNGQRGTFVVNVMYRQNSSWQGKVYWAEQNKTCTFRSALELMKLIDGALDAAGEDDECQELFGEEASA